MSDSGVFLRILWAPSDSPRLKEIYRQAEACLKHGRKPPWEIWYVHGKHNADWLKKRVGESFFFVPENVPVNARWAWVLYRIVGISGPAIYLGLDLLCVYKIRPRLFWRRMAEGHPLRFGLQKVGKWQDGGGLCVPYPQAVYCRDIKVAELLLREAESGKSASECLATAREHLGIAPFDPKLDLPIVRHPDALAPPDPAIFQERRESFRSYQVGLRGCAKQRAPAQSWIDARLPSRLVSTLMETQRVASYARDNIKTIGFLTPSLQLGGAERWLTDLVSGLDSKRFDVMAVGTEIARPPFEPFVKRITNRCPILEGPHSWPLIAKNSDTIVAWGVRSLEQLKDFRGPIVYVSQGPGWYTDDCIKRCLPRVTHQVAVSRSAATVFPDTSVVTIVPNGVCEAAMQEHRSRDEVRQSWGVKPHEILVGYVGRFSPEKKPVEVADVVAKLGKPYRLVYVGDGHCRTEMLKEAKRICPDLIHQPATPEIGDCYRALDALVLLSDSEGFSHVLVEAWYCGTPTICKPVGAVPDLEAEHCQLATPVPIDATVDQVVDAIRRGAAPGVVDRARRVAREHYTEAAMCRRWGEYLTGILEP